MASVPVYRIHPGLGVARVGDSPDSFYIGPDAPAALPTECDGLGNPCRSPDGAEVPVGFAAVPAVEADLLVRVRDEGINAARSHEEILAHLDRARV